MNIDWHGIIKKTDTSWKYPYINTDTGTWWQWSEEKNAYVNTEINALGYTGDTGPQGDRGPQGDAGTSVFVTSITESSVDGGDNIITLSDGHILIVRNGSTGERGPAGRDGIDGLPGADGSTGPQGPKGDPGIPGAGVTVVDVSESDVDGGTNIVTFSDGTTLAVKNGNTGSQGPRGYQGQTGLPGKDGKDGQNYVITSADYQNIADLVDTMIADERQQALDDIDDAKTDAVGDVSAEGTTQVGLVAAKGQEVIQSIPSDYSELSDDVSELKADFTHKEDWVVGNAEQLLSDKYTEDSEPYVFRKSISGDREIDEIVGGTIAWNQLIRYPNDGDTGAGMTFNINNGIITLSGTSTKGYINCFRNYNAVKDHVYLLTSMLYANPNNISFKVGSLNGRGLVYAGQSTIVKSSSSGYNSFGIESIGQGTDVTGVKFSVLYSDLTQMFGSTIADYIYSLEQTAAGAGAEFFRKLFPKPYYDYNAGELKSITGLVSHDTVGFNQWDEEWELGQFNNQTGLPISANDCIRSKNFIPVLPNTSYYTTYGNGNMQVFFYGADESFISQAWVGVTNLITTPNGCYKMKFRNASSYGTTYKHDICINIFDPTKNGTHEPYKKRSYPLDSSLTLRGIPKLANNKMYFDGDTYASDGTVTRKYGIVESSECVISAYDAASGRWLLNLPQTAKMPKQVSSTEAINALVSNGRLQTTYKNAINSTVKYAIARSDATGSSSFIFALDLSTITTVTQAREWVTNNQFVLVYELATETTEEADPFQSLQICSEYGTEEYVYDSEAFHVPVGHITKYPDNLRKKLDGLPWDLSMLAPIETGTEASQAYAIGKYFLLNNQFCKAKTAIASGATFTLNTNYEVTTVADELYSALHS